MHREALSLLHVPEGAVSFRAEQKPRIRVSIKFDQNLCFNLIKRGNPSVLLTDFLFLYDFLAANWLPVVRVFADENQFTASKSE